ncbi:hypothetical protein POTOM_059013 [Populus tomentosa]|uniref:Apyrase n=1 Tax=Populus tomentosa TaxID=118781 RepID=A0A8X7XSW3_POPTO|nr:hypothetical protein POTOM_059013 [Populus tomentosa]
MNNKLKLMSLIPFFLLMVFVLPASAAYKFTNPRIVLPVRSKGSDADSRSYAVVFDAGSTGSRVHVFCFDQNFDLLPVGNDTEFEFFAQVKPGLSAYAKDPQAAANSLAPLLNEAEGVVPEEFSPKTPVRLGATAGLRLLEGDSAERILEAVRDLLSNGSLEYEADDVSILTGSQEGYYMWIAINYMVGNLGKPYSETAAVIDQGGGSVQMAYAISRENAEKAPAVADGEDPYVEKFLLRGAEYYVYVHSYLSYGLLASRAEILKVSRNSSNECVTTGYNGVYTYGGKEYKASSSPTGTSFKKCRTLVLKALKINAPCKYVNCTFGGVWNGGGGDGQNNFYVNSYFFTMSQVAGFVDANAYTATASAADFKKAAKRACETRFEDASSRFPNALEGDLPFLCMDFTYEYTLLVDGFGLHPQKKFSLEGQIKYKNSLMGAAWPLGSAIEAVSPSRASFLK